MSNLIKTLVVALLALGCSAPFESADLDAIGGDTGESGEGATEAGSGPSSGGSASVAGKPAGGSATAGHAGTAGVAPGGSSSGGQPTAGMGTGGAAPSCEFDESKLTALLPAAFVWQDFMYTSGEFCVKCRDMPCGTLNVISWGVPNIDDGGGYVYSPNADAPMVSVELGVNDGTCASVKSCGVKMYLGSVRFLVEPIAGGWAVSAVASPSGAGNACIDSYTGAHNTASVAGADLAKEIEVSLDGLEIPCN